MAQPGSAAAFGQKAFIARNCTEGDAVRSSQLIGTVTRPSGGGGWYSERRTSGGTGCELGTGSGDIECKRVTILQLYALEVVPPEAEGRTVPI